VEGTTRIRPKSWGASHGHDQLATMTSLQSRESFLGATGQAATRVGAPAALFAPRCGGPRARFFWCHGGRAEPAVHRLLWCRKDAAARRCCCVRGELSPSPAAPRGCCSLRSSRPWAGWNCLAPCSASSGLLYSAMAFSCSLEQRLPGFHNRVQCSVVKAHNGAGKTVH